MNYYGELGYAKDMNTNEVKEFKEVEFFRDVDIEQICISDHHTLVLTS